MCSWSPFRVFHKFTKWSEPKRAYVVDAMNKPTGEKTVAQIRICLNCGIIDTREV